MNMTERRGAAAVSWFRTTKPQKLYEDRYRLLTRDILLVGKSTRGELYGVFDGIGSAPMGMAAAQAMADAMTEFYRKPDDYPADWQGLNRLLHEANCTIFGWGFMDGTDRPLGGCAGTVAWINNGKLVLFHAGDTAAILLRPDRDPQVLTRIHEANGGIYRYFGLGEELKIDVESFGVEEGDLLLLVSDGVTKVFSTTEAASVARETFDKTGDVGAAAQELASRSRGKKSSDDITVLLIEVCDE
jgi:PPM family protein phosphatase